MSSFFFNMPIGRKLTLITMLISGVALLLGCTAFAIYEHIESRRELARDFAIIADIFDDNVAAGLIFGDSVAMAQTLKSLDADRRILAAGVYDKAGALVARYQRADLPAAFAFPKAQETGQHFTSTQLDTFKDIPLDGETIGTVYFAIDLHDLHARAWRYAQIIGALVVACSLLALLLASRLQGIVSEPIIALAATVAVVTADKNYSVRAIRRGNDEVGRLIDGFNGMLDQIQVRDAALDASRRELENRVDERTKELAKSLSMLNATLESTADGIVVVDLDGRTVSFNSQYAALWNFPAAMLARRDATETRTHIAQQIKDSPRFLRRVAELQRAPESEGFDLIELKDDRIFERYVFPQRIGPECVGVVIHWRDVTERKRAEERLRLLSSAVEQSKESILITDAQLDRPGPRIVFANPAYTRMTGYTVAEAIGTTPRVLQGPHTDRAVLDRLRKNLERGEVFAGEAINYRKDGSEFTLEWQIAPILNAGGKITHFVALQRDITKRKESESELETAHQQLLEASRLAGMAEVATGVLHNVGNVLNSVNVSATLVADQVRHSKAGNVAKLAALFAEHQADLAGFLIHDPRGKMIPAYLATLTNSLADEQKAVTAELDHLRKNIDHIKDIVAMQQSYAKNSGVIESVALIDLVEDALRMNASSLARHDVEVVCDFQARPVISTDKHKVVQIIVNLVRNAKFACDESSNKSKRITVRTAAAGQTVSVAVIDNGVGIPAENLTRIFAHGFTTRKTGHGFGLHSGALAAKELGGAIRVTSDGPGTGATFTLELPGPSAVAPLS
jgi:PAS domain S-box-containing protein